jgi:hypothetical protein
MSGRHVVAQRLVDFWRKELYTDDNGNKMHPEDREILLEKTAISCGEGDFANPVALHLRLTPVPYVGNLTKADIFLAVKNPTVGPQDYTDNKEPDFKEPDFQKLLENNLHQEKVDYCFALNPACPWESWAKYYQSLFRSFVKECAENSRVFSKMPNPKASVWEELKSRVAILELLPYYSKNAPNLVEPDFKPALPSISAAREFLRTVAEHEPKEETLILCRWIRTPMLWGIPESRVEVITTMQGMCPRSKLALCQHLEKRPSAHSVN